MQSDADSDETLVALARGGDRQAFARLVVRHQPLVRRVCHGALGSHDGLEDVVQEAVLQALLGLHTLREPRNFGSWLAGIGLNVARRTRRSGAREAWSWEALLGGRLVTEPISVEPEPLEQVALAEMGERVRQAVADLPRGQRAAILLVYLSGLTYRETAAALGVPVCAVKTRLHKGRHHLRQRLHSLWMEDGSSMTTTSVAQPPVAMRVTDVRRWPAEGDAPSRSVLLLGEIGGSRLLPIWTGNWEGDAIAMLLEKVQVPRPLTHAFAARLLVAAGVQVKEVRVSRLTDETFYAQVVLRAGAAIEREVDARPSDAIALALETGAPIFVAAEVLAAIEAARAAAGDVPPAATAIGAAQIVDELIERWPRGPKPTRSS